MNVKETSQGITFEIKVRTNSDNFRLYHKEESLFIDVRSPPEQGKANTEIVKELSRLFKKNVEIVKGLKSSRKLILVKNIEKSALLTLISRLEQI